MRNGSPSEAVFAFCRLLPVIAGCFGLCLYTIETAIFCVAQAIVFSTAKAIMPPTRKQSAQGSATHEGGRKVVGMRLEWWMTPQVSWLAREREFRGSLGQHPPHPPR